MEAAAQRFDRIGGYERVLFIGRGGMGEVWSAVKPSTMKVYAIKILHPDLTDSDEYHAMFFREAAIAAQLASTSRERLTPSTKSMTRYKIPCSSPTS